MEDDAVAFKAVERGERLEEAGKSFRQIDVRQTTHKKEKEKKQRHEQQNGNAWHKQPLLGGLCGLFFFFFFLRGRALSALHWFSLSGL
jgi:Flp pilus assembly protein TadB